MTLFAFRGANSPAWTFCDPTNNHHKEGILEQVGNKKQGEGPSTGSGQAGGNVKQGEGRREEGEGPVTREKVSNALL